jgi:Predicted membrane protein (DUF2306)
VSSVVRRTSARSVLTRPWVGPLAVLAAVFLAVSLPRYLTLDPGRCRSMGPPVSLTLLGLLRPASTIAGYRMARRRRFAEHREWMIRSFALSFSIVTNRFWGVLRRGVRAGLAGRRQRRGARRDRQAMGVSFWLCWVVDPLVAEWWIRRRRAPRPPPLGLAAKDLHGSRVCREERLDGQLGDGDVQRGAEGGDCAEEGQLARLVPEPQRHHHRAGR